MIIITSMMMMMMMMMIRWRMMRHDMMNIFFARIILWMVTIIISIGDNGSSVFSYSRCNRTNIRRRMIIGRRRKRTITTASTTVLPTRLRCCRCDCGGGRRSMTRK